MLKLHVQTLYKEQGVSTFMHVDPQGPPVKKQNKKTLEIFSKLLTFIKNINITTLIQLNKW